MRIDVGPDDDPVALVRAATGDSVVLVIAPGRAPLELAQTRAAIAPLAVERAPAMRVNAVLPMSRAARADVDAAAAFLEQARSTTGQMLVVDA